MSDSDGSEFAIQMLTRWADLDALGHVNHATFFTFVESARMQFFNAIGLTALQSEGTCGPVLVAASMNYRAQVRDNEALRVALQVTRIGNSSFVLKHRVERPEQTSEGTPQVVADGETTVVWLDYTQNRSQPLPKVLRDALSLLGE